MVLEPGAFEFTADVSVPELPVSPAGLGLESGGLKGDSPVGTGVDSGTNVGIEAPQVGEVVPAGVSRGVLVGSPQATPERTPEDDHPHDECGVFGVWAPGEDVSRLTYFGLYALQHRGQESAGIATSDGSKILVFKDMGLVSQVFTDRDLETLRGHIAVGHVRYATAGASSWHNAQPTLGPTAFGTLALAHNGNLVNARELAGRWLGTAGAAGCGAVATAARTGAVTGAVTGADSRGAIRDTDTAPEPGAGMGTKRQGSGAAPHEAAKPTRPTQVGKPTPLDSTSDTMLLTKIIEAASHEGGENLWGVMRRILPQLDGAYSLAFMDETTLYAARDPHGIRPLVLGRLAGDGTSGENPGTSPASSGRTGKSPGDSSLVGACAASGWVVASETAALDIVGAEFVREIAPGELLAINETGVRSERFAPARPAGCVFEYVYLARPDTQIAGRSIIAARREMGAALARSDRSEWHGRLEADLVMATPDSGTPAAIGYAEESGIPFVQGLVKNAYVGRTFIQPTQAMRQMGIRLKLNPVRSVIEGKRLVVIDDSIVRGNTQRAVVRMLRAAGAREVHVRISSPPVLWPCFYGIDFASRDELIATGMGVAEICRSLEADSLAYLRFDAMVAATGQPEGSLCTACFSGQYPTGIPAAVPRGVGRTSAQLQRGGD